MNNQQLNKDTTTQISSKSKQISTKLPTRIALLLIIALVGIASVACTSNTQISYGEGDSVSKALSTAILPAKCDDPSQGLIGRFILETGSNVVWEKFRLNNGDLTSDQIKLKYHDVKVNGSSEPIKASNVKFVAEEQWKENGLDKRTSLFAILMENSPQSSSLDPSNNNRRRIFDNITRTLNTLAKTLKEQSTQEPYAGYYIVDGDKLKQITGQGQGFSKTYTNPGIKDFPSSNKKPEIFKSIKTLVSKMESFSPPGSLTVANKTILLVVSGPDYARPDSAAIDEAIKEAKDAKIRVFVLHIDPPITDAKNLKIMEEPYKDSQSSPCSDDSNCRDYEKCYSLDSSSSDKYCFVRKKDGKTGPLPYYAKLACGTEGGYIYIKESHVEQSRYMWAPEVNYGLWEQTLSGDAVTSISFTIEGELKGTVQGEPITLPSKFNFGYAK